MAASLLADPLVVLLLLAFVPPLLYLAGLARRHPGPTAGRALVGFLYGATLSLAVLAVLYVLVTVALGHPVRAFQSFFADRNIGVAAEKDFVLVVVLAPMLEELAKGFGVYLLGVRFASRRDGTFLGASVGLGFAAIETFTYLLAALQDGGSQLAGATLFGLLVLAGLRSLSSALVHPAATGITGYGIARARLSGRSAVVGALPYYVFAVVLHGSYNYLVAYLPPQDIGGFTVELNLLAALLLASVAWGGLKGALAARG